MNNRNYKFQLSVFIFVLSVGLVSSGATLDKFDFTPESIESARVQAEGGDSYFQGLYGGMQLWGYVKNSARQTQKDNAEVGTDEKTGANKGKNTDWFEVAEEKVKKPEASDKTQGGDWIDKSAVAKNPIGLYFQAYRLEKKKGIRDIVELRALWREAIVGLVSLGKDGDPVALTLLGLMQEDGFGVEKSSVKAKEMFRKAAEMKSALAAHKLSEYLLNDAKSKDEYLKVLELNTIAKEGKVRGAEEITPQVYAAAEKRFAASAFPFLPMLLPGQYHFLGFFSKTIVNVGGWLAALVGGLFGWFVFPYALAPIKLLVRAPMEIFVDRIIGAIFLFIFCCVITKVWLVNLLF